jgi:hypothetical protein
VEDDSTARPRGALANRSGLRIKCIRYLREHV